MILPSIQELLDAWDQMAADGPVPLAGLVDAIPALRHSVEYMADSPFEFPGYTSHKAAMVHGLNLGIRIGEARLKKRGPIENLQESVNARRSCHLLIRPVRGIRITRTYAAAVRSSSARSERGRRAQ